MLIKQTPKITKKNQHLIFYDIPTEKQWKQHESFV